MGQSLCSNLKNSPVGWSQRPCHDKRYIAYLPRLLGRFWLSLLALQSVLELALGWAKGDPSPSLNSLNHPLPAKSGFTKSGGFQPSGGFTKSGGFTPSGSFTPSGG